MDFGNSGNFTAIRKNTLTEYEINKDFYKRDNFMPSSFNEKSGDVIMTHCLVLNGHDLIKDFSELWGFEKYRVR